MIVKVLAAASLLAAPVPVSAPSVPEQPAIPKVVCPMQFSYSAGTAFRVSAHLLLSVKHVTSASSACQIDGQRINILYTGKDQDFSILLDNRPGPFLRVDCGGFVAGRKYLAIGHARAMDELTVVPLIALGKKQDGWSLLTGVFEVQPGQSGGAIVDAETLRVVGTVNAADWEQGISYSVALADTPICRKPA